MKRARILLADDHKLMAEALQHLLQTEFDVVGTVSDGRALIKAAAELKPELVIVDIGMPLLNGLDAADQLKGLHPDIKVIFLTQNREPRMGVSRVGSALAMCSGCREGTETGSGSTASTSASRRGTTAMSMAGSGTAIRS